MGTNEQACEKAYLQYEHLKILENLEIQNSTIRIDIRHVPPKVTQTPSRAQWEQGNEIGNELGCHLSAPQTLCWIPNYQSETKINFKK